MIEVKNLTLTYGNGKGIFHLNFTVNQGEVVGFLGPNGAGKTTTIRNLLGFMKADEGSSKINNLDTFTNATTIQKHLGYVPGEIAFLEHLTGQQLLKLISDLRGMNDLTRQKELLDLFELELHGPIKRYSKGMKQKLGIVIAFMHDPDVIILDEPTSGLDPLMQQRFIDFLLAEKAKGKTIFMSSHLLEEIEKTCDRIIMIKDGIIIADSATSTLKENQRKRFIIKTQNDMQAFISIFEVTKIQEHTYQIYVSLDEINTFIKLLSLITIQNIELQNQSLEDLFMDYYQKGGNEDELSTL